MSTHSPQTVPASSRVKDGTALLAVMAGLVFLLSGIAGLIYEVVWFRMLFTKFGSTGPALAATTVAFMAGLGLGSQMMGCWADRLSKPLLVYAILELCIAASALAVPQLIAIVDQFQAAIVPGEEANLALELVHFVVILVVLVLPTALMGATLPALTRAIVNSDATLGRRFAWIYGINTLGAAIGAVAAGFYLIPALGIRNTSLIAVWLNVCAAFVALLIRQPPRRTQFSSSPVAPHEIKPSQSVPEKLQAADLLKLYIGVFFSGFVSLAAQYHWTRSLIFSFDRLKNTTYSFSIVLGVTLVGLVIGSLGTQFIVDRSQRPMRLFGVILGMLGVSIASSVFVLLGLPQLVDVIDAVTLRLDFVNAVQQVTWRTILVMGASTVLMGASLPVAVRSAARSQNVGRSVGRLYMVNTFGAVTGALSAAFVLTPLLGLTQGLVVLGVIAVLASVWIVTERWDSLRFIGVSLTMGAVSATCLLAGETWALQNLRPGEKILRYRDGTLATVCVIESENGERRICVDDVPVAGTSTIMQTDQKSLAHWGMMLADEPKRALTVGFGSGGASYSFLLHDGLEHLDCVEICRDVPRFADLLTDANHGLLERDDPRYRILFADARAYLHRAHRSYDVIVSDCTDLRYRSSANLYDREYFQLCRDRLTPSGCVVIWMPLGGLSASDFALTLNTFASVFPDAGVFYLHNRWTHYVMLVGKNEPVHIDLRRIREMLAEPDVRDDLAEIGMTNPYKAAATYLSSAKALQPILEQAGLNTENHPVLEFAVPKFDTGPWSAQRNLNLLRNLRGSIDRVLPESMPSDDKANVVRFGRASEAILAAQEAERRFEFEAATLYYIGAQKLTPEDDAIATALEFPELRTLAEQGNPTAWLLLGRSRQLQQRHDQALAFFDRYREAMNRIDPPRNSLEEQNLRQAQAWRDQEVNWRRELTGSTGASADPTAP